MRRVAVMTLLSMLVYPAPSAVTFLYALLPAIMVAALVRLALGLPALAVLPIALLLCLAALAWRCRVAIGPSPRTVFLHRWPPRRSANLVVRRPTPRDATAVAKVYDEEARRANGLSRTATRSWAWATKLGEPEGLLVACDRSGMTVGVLQLRLSGADTCELGWVTAPHARGQGFGAEAVAVTIAGLHELGIRRILAGTHKDNLGMRKILQRAGAQEAETTTHELPDGSTVPSVWYTHEI